MIRYTFLKKLISKHVDIASENFTNGHNSNLKHDAINSYTTS